MQDDALALLLDVGDADDTGCCSRATELQNFVAAISRLLKFVLATR
jgi:hypothetical protein